jgi:antitoxin (DNA-binding transcriptional repressor) of toxin-antitoxin stability system
MVLMAHYSIVQAQDRLSELVQRALAGEDVVITRDDARPLLRLTPVAASLQRARQPGSAKGQITWMAPDFEAPLDDFAEYR